MEYDVFLSGFGRANQQQQPQEYPLYTDTVGIFVDPGWGSSSQTGIQLCPALFISSAANIPKAVKHIYRQILVVNFGWDWQRQIAVVWPLPPRKWTRACPICCFPWSAPEIPSALRFPMEWT
jgi:hypothetical protein